MSIKNILLFVLAICITNAGAQENAVFFTDSPDGDQLYDPSWGYVNSPSELEKAGADKFPVDAQHPYKGAHSLRLHWTSNSGGDWGIAVASPGWPGYDFTMLDSIVYWINGPLAIASAELPTVAVEDLSNKVSTRVNLGDYLQDGLDADSLSWQKVMISIGDLQPGPNNTDFTKIKTIYHHQNTADGVEYTVWLDEIRAI